MAAPPPPTFADHFSPQAEAYRRHRPGYPATLFEYLAALAPGTQLAWDCGCGSGQAAVDLALRFDTVIATDPSPAQLAQAPARANLLYRQAAETDPALTGASVDLVTAAQAAHWFDAPRFHAEVDRVLKPGGVLALWTYGLPSITPAVDACLATYHGVTVGPFWPAERRHVDGGYRDLPFPYPDLPVPRFEHVTHWDLTDLLAHLGTWSATRYYRERQGTDPVELARPCLARAWGAADQARAVRWPISLRVGRKP